MADKSIQDMLDQRNTPADRILTWAFNLSCDYHDILLEKIPQIEAYSNSSGLGNFLQIGTIISTLLQIERHHDAPDYTKLHQDIVQNIAPSMRDKYMPLLQELSYFLLENNVPLANNDEIPSLNSLFTKNDRDLEIGIGVWLVHKLKSEMPSDPFDLKIVELLGNIVFVKNSLEIIMLGNLLDTETKSSIV